MKCLEVYHNILWSKYKGGVFSELYRACTENQLEVKFVQIAETETDRIALGGVDLSYHKYPYRLLFKGAYRKVPVLRRVIALALMAARSRADLVILAGYDQVEYWAMLAVLVARQKRVAVFCDSTAYDRPRVRLKAVAKATFFHLCDGFFVYGSRSKDYLKSHGVPPEKVFVRCQAAVFPDSYRSDDAIAKRIALLESGTERDRFLYVGRLSSEKGLHTLLLAFAAVARVSPSASLHICGAGPDFEVLMRTAMELGIENKVIFEGSLDLEKLSLQYLHATALVLPSFSEPWGLVVNEALSFGCPVIVSHRCGCVPELVHDGQTGYVFEAGNVDELSRRMIKLSSKGLSESKKIALNAITLIQEYSPAAAAAQILAGSLALIRGDHAT